MDYLEQAAALYREAARAALDRDGHANRDRILRAAEGLTRIAAIERGIVPPDWGRPAQPDADREAG